jgi:hypothetical protein
LRRGPLAGALTATATGGLMAVLVAFAGRDVAGLLPAIVALTAPLLAAGVAFGWLMDRGRLRSLGLAVLFWTVAFPAARLAQELLVGVGLGGLQGGLPGFLAYQAIIGTAFGLGFALLYQQVVIALGRLRGERATIGPTDGPPSGPDRP